mmetsp:Transcript_13620/g.33335  ORF Transcript_13620/g.33335 Transcript_13620/m.33335 type:complete len:82 (-) Transcript_13620:244-489(-)
MILTPMKFQRKTLARKYDRTGNVNIFDAHFYHSNILNTLKIISRTTTATMILAQKPSTPLVQIFWVLQKTDHTRNDENLDG